MNDIREAILATKAKRLEKVTKLLHEKADDRHQQYDHLLRELKKIALADFLEYSQTVSHE